MLIDSARREPVAVTRRGRPVAYVVSPEDIEDLLDGRDAADALKNDRVLSMEETSAFFDSFSNVRR